MNRNARSWGSTYRQDGLSMWGWMYVLATLGLILFAGIRSFPKYMEFFDVRNTIEWAASQPELVKATPAEIRKRIGKRFSTGYVDVVKSKDVKVLRKKKGGRELKVSWEVREAFMGNVDLVYNFEVAADLTGTAQP